MSEERKNVHFVIKRYMILCGYKVLKNEYCDCSCSLSNLMICGEPSPECKFYKK